MSARARIAVLVAALGACAVPPEQEPTASELVAVTFELDQPEPEPVNPPRDDEIVVCGERIPIGTRVVLWSEPGGYDAYSTELRFPLEAPKEPPEGLRYQPGRRAGGVEVPGAANASCRADLERVLEQFVLHYDVCGTSRQCFKILHDRRGLSVHFLLDLDGTLYQTLDLCETAWHARQANARSVGIEIANIGAYRPGATTLGEWYVRDESGPRVQLPAWMAESGVRKSEFVARPARSEPVRGEIHGAEVEMFDLTR